ncbi:MAG: hypothetical protein EA398_02325 [Deltaproteobacteria bacterium]|nr:MAG: hypothetical protein EA398_02325 [Deltaproteobacteria bacterium]
MRATVAVCSSLLSFLVVSCFLAGCGGEIRDDYEAFLQRVDRTNPNVIDGEAARGRGVVADITGQHLLNVDLKPIGSVRLLLRASVLTFEELPEGTPEQPDARGRITGEFRLAEADPTVFEPRSEPLATFESYIEEDGFMEINLGRVYVPPSLSPIPDTAVDVVLNFKAVILDEDTLCGYIDDPEVTVISPAPLGLVGTTFGSRRWNPDGSQPPTVPDTCPFSLGLPDGPPPPDVEPGDLVPPGLDTPFGQLADLTGRFFMRAAVAGSPLVLDFILDAVMEEFPEGERPPECRQIAQGSNRVVRAELRTFTNDDRYGPEDPSVGAFCAQVSTSGRFNAVVEGIVAPSSLGEVNADIALSLVTVDADTFCGGAAGTVTTPLSLNLSGSTAGFVRMPDDFWGLPDNPIAGCPPTQADPPGPLDEEGERQDIDGRWFFSIETVGGVGDRAQRFQFIGDLRYFAEEEDDTDAVVDAVIRRFGEGARPTDPAVGFVTGSTVDERGQFTLRINGPLGTDPTTERSVEGNIALRAVIRDADTLCGAGQGRIFRPFQAPFVDWRFTAARLPANVWGEVESLPSCD